MDHPTKPSLHRQLDILLVIFAIAVLFMTGSLAFKFGWH
jgi:hypothetical protein